MTGAETEAGAGARTGARAVPPGELPGVRAQLRAVAADLAAGLNCLWLVTDAMVESGLADELYRGALSAAPIRVDIPPPASAHPHATEPEPGPGAGEFGVRADTGGGADRDGPADGVGWADAGGPADTGGWADADELPFLDLPDDGFDLDLGWSLDGAPPRVPAPRKEPTGPRHDPHGLLARLGKELSVDADEAVASLVAPGRYGRPVVGIRAWAETEAPGTRTGALPGTRTGTPSGVVPGAPSGAPSGVLPTAAPGAPPGAPVERLFRSLAAAVKDAGLPPAERPRLLVVARLRDLPEPLPDELRHGLGDTAVHWWWGALGRLDTATAIAPVLDHAPGTSGRDRHRHSDPLAERIRRAVRSETVVEVCGPDLELARLLALDWDGAQHTLGAALGRCLARSPGPVPADCPPLRRIGALLRPGAELRQAWARGAVVSWEGRLRAHVGVWHPAAPSAPATGEAEDRLTALVSQAQQRVLTPWIEEARQRLAVRALGHLNRPVATLVAGYSARPPAYLGRDPERAFLELQVGELLRAHIGGALALPARDAALLRLLVDARNVLAHRSVLYDRTLDELCAELSQADLRAP
ncbi:hypothetical protein [Streptomyces zaomyceticus]|uniref:hypothetical protein n=1 Tax=Streptomyces zaomyceticus TaxID=68286 RepID=UPI00167331D7|nr:hypothetical protein [Streptomyces zaomyceticus]GHG01152.1 hypothetical protein GCM10018791_10510 [Streptomyces zaomyceticus]